MEVLLGCILGDGSIRKGKSTNANARYSITIKAASKDYIELLCQVVFSFCHCSKLIPYPNVNLKRHEGKKILQYHFATGSIKFFTELHTIWYNLESSGNYKKVVPQNIQEIFTVESLAHWIIQDGYFDNNGRIQTTILCTESFSKSECYLLQSVLRKYNIKSSLKVRDKNKGTYRIRISKTSINQVRALVQDIIPSNYHYKIGILKPWALLKLHYMLELPKAVNTSFWSNSLTDVTMGNQQETKFFHEKVGSSETTREAG